MAANHASKYKRISICARAGASKFGARMNKTPQRVISARHGVKFRFHATVGRKSHFEGRH